MPAPLLSAPCAPFPHRVFSIDPIEGYRPPTLAGHKERLVAVHFAGEAIQRAARALGKVLPSLYTLSRDGALFAWAYHRGGSGEAGGSGDEGAPEPKAVEAAAGHWMVRSGRPDTPDCFRVSA